MSLTYVAAKRGIVLSPGFLNDHTGAFAWTPFACEETIPCVVCTHKEDHRESIHQFLSLLRSLYAARPDFPC